MLIALKNPKLKKISVMQISKIFRGQSKAEYLEYPIVCYFHQSISIVLILTNRQTKTSPDYQLSIFHGLIICVSNREILANIHKY